MTRQEFKALRESLYAAIKSVDDSYRRPNTSPKVSGYLNEAIERAYPMLDTIDQLGADLGYLNPETNEETE